VQHSVWNDVGKPVAAFTRGIGFLLLSVIAGMAAGAVLGALFGGFACVVSDKDGVFVPVVLRMGFAGGVATGLAALCRLMDRCSSWVNYPLPDEEQPWTASRSAANSWGSNPSAQKSGQSLFGNGFP
jgi:hypothetical protein